MRVRQPLRSAALIVFLSADACAGATTTAEPRTAKPLPEAVVVEDNTDWSKVEPLHAALADHLCAEADEQQAQTQRDLRDAIISREWAKDSDTPDALSRRVQACDEAAVLAKKRRERCHVEAEMRRKQRLDQLSKVTLETIQAIPAKYRLPEEERRLKELQLAQKDEARARRQAARDAKRNDGTYMRPALTATLCWYQRERDNAMQEIETEQHYGRIGGFVDAEKLYLLQRRVRNSDVGIATQNAEMKRLKIKPLPCSMPLVVTLMKCLLIRDGNSIVVHFNPESDDSCGAPEIKAYNDVADAIPWE